jgi:hypothetical protein
MISCSPSLNRAIRPGKPLAKFFSISVSGNGVNILPAKVLGQPGNVVTDALVAGVSNRADTNGINAAITHAIR